MSTPQIQTTKKTLHPNAQTLITEYSKEFDDSLASISIMIAESEGMDEVQSVHVQKAKGVIMSLTQRANDKKAFVFGLACAFLGIAIQGMIAEYLTVPARPGWLIMYSIVAIISAFAISQIYKIDFK